jgi:hypothetical protein
MIRKLGLVLALLTGAAAAQEPAAGDTYYCGLFDYLAAPSSRYGSPRPRGYGGEACLGARPAGAWVGYEVQIFHDALKRLNTPSTRRSGAALDLTIPFQFEKYKPFLLVGAGGETTNVTGASRLKVMYEAGAGVAWGAIDPWKVRVRFEAREVYQRINGVSLLDLYAKVGFEVPFGEAAEASPDKVKVVPPEPAPAAPPPAEQPPAEQPKKP